MVNVGDVLSRSNIHGAGLSDVHIAAILGNLMHESKFSGSIEGDKHLSTSSFGIAQWRGGRLSNLKSFAEKRGADWREVRIQAEFLLHELQTGYKSSALLGTRPRFDRNKGGLMGANTLEDAVRIFEEEYERPAKGTYGQRLRYAQDIYKALYRDRPAKQVRYPG